MEQAIGEKLDGSPLDDPHKGKNPAAVALGKLGGAKGGKARAQALTAEQRADIARTYPMLKLPRDESRMNAQCFSEP